MLGTPEIHLPRDELEFYSWAALLIILYTVLALTARLARGKRHFQQVALVFDAATFSGSVLLFSRVASSLSFSHDLSPPDIVGNPPLGESVKLV